LYIYFWGSNWLRVKRRGICQNGGVKDKRKKQGKGKLKKNDYYNWTKIFRFLFFGLFGCFDDYFPF